MDKVIAHKDEKVFKQQWQYFRDICWQNINRTTKKEAYAQSITLEQLFNEGDWILGNAGWHKIRAEENGVKRWCLLPRDKQDTEKKRSWGYLHSCKKSSCQAVFVVRAGKVSACVGVHEWDESFSEIESREQQNQRSPWMYSSRLARYSDVS